MARSIPWSLHTEIGSYNQTFLYSNIQQYLDLFGRYYDIVFPRTNDGRIKFIQAGNAPTAGWAMWTNRATFTTRIAANFNFKKNNLVCCQCINHEFGHDCSNLAHLPANLGALMGPNASCTNFTKLDYQYFPYAWKGALRPDQEPLKMQQTFGVSALKGLFQWSPVPKFGCGTNHNQQPSLVQYPAATLRAAEIDWSLVP